jgi:hypothetical protein
LGEPDATVGTDDVTLVERQTVGRVPDLVPFRYGRMLVNPSTFFPGRGAADAC